MNLRHNSITQVLRGHLLSEGHSTRCSLGEVFPSAANTQSLLSRNLKYNQGDDGMHI